MPHSKLRAKQESKAGERLQGHTGTMAAQSLTRILESKKDILFAGKKVLTESDGGG
jgi:hypothetical protein